MSRLWKRMAFLKDKRIWCILFLLILMIILIVGIAVKGHAIAFKNDYPDVGNAHQVTGRTINELRGMGEKIVKTKSELLEKRTPYEAQSKGKEAQEEVTNDSEAETFHEERSVFQNSEEEGGSGGYQEWYDQDGMIWNGGELSPDDYDWDQIGW